MEVKGWESEEECSDDGHEEDMDSEEGDFFGCDDFSANDGQPDQLLEQIAKKHLEDVGSGEMGEYFFLLQENWRKVAEEQQKMGEEEVIWQMWSKDKVGNKGGKRSGTWQNLKSLCSPSSSSRCR